MLRDRSFVALKKASLLKKFARCFVCLKSVLFEPFVLVDLQHFETDNFLSNSLFCSQIYRESNGIRVQKSQCDIQKVHVILQLVCCLEM